jgi:hypothetical protein
MLTKKRSDTTLDMPCETCACQFLLMGIVLNYTLDSKIQWKLSLPPNYRKSITNEYHKKSSGRNIT